jgi:hypothetical protein
LKPEYRQLRASIRASRYLSVDETGWRVGRHNVWLHGWVKNTATAYAINSQGKRIKKGLDFLGFFDIFQ